MALVRERVDAIADAAQELSEELLRMRVKLDAFIELNSDVSIDWAAGSTPSYIEEDAAGNIVDRTFSRQQVANMIGSIANILAAYTTAADGAAADHLGNLNQLARASRV